ncbi:MMPL family transporter [Halostagnicola sp. A56]|uniref:MMPL family transporter n=1 Tax=Halostagnicola sp. A56 TaxID=1495067 RepID=UPI0004A0EB1F|nr:MMPL family transporter [Halostagnicola sp. A56]
MTGKRPTDDEAGSVRSRRLADAITTHTRLVIGLLLVLTLIFGAGIPALEYDASMKQFASGTDEAQALAYANENFSAQTGTDSSVAAITVRDENALSKASLRESLALQRQLHANGTVEASLAEESPIVGVENVVATAAIREPEAEALRERGAELEERARRLNATATELRGDLETVRDRQIEYERLNASLEDGRIDSETYRARSRAIESSLEGIKTSAATDLETDQSRSFNRSVASVRAIQSEINAAERAVEADNITQTTAERRTDRLESDLESAYADGTVGVFTAEYDRIWNERRALEAQRDALESTDLPPLDEQVAALESLDESAYDALLESVLGNRENPIGELATTLLPASAEPGSTDIDQRLIIIRQSAESGDDKRTGATGNTQPVESQLAIQQVVESHGDDATAEYAVFGNGIVTDEIDRAIVDSLQFVGPLAFALVLVSLWIAYRDPLEVTLGVVGIAVVLIWTLGFMGWTGIAFNQLFVAIPALLIGLSIDYAIHVFMRHRERRTAGSTSVRPAMAVALAGVGAALVWVTVTTAIGFLSNLVSPIGPLREFGLVSTVGIVAALFVFGALMPSVKVELEEFFASGESDRPKAALGTRDGAVRESLSIGAKAARIAPIVVLIAVLAVTAGSLYAAEDVDTSFEQTDLLAEEPAWLEDIPGATSDGYQAKAGYERLRNEFEYRDAQAQIVIRGEVTDGETLERIDAARTRIGESESADDPGAVDASGTDPLTAMESAAERNESFNATFQLADRTGDGVPDQNIEGLYDRLYEVDAGAASEVVHRTDDGEYESVRMLVPVSSDVDDKRTTAEMRTVAETIDGEGTEPRWNATATGPPIVTHVVETDLFEGILESLAITLLAVFAVLTVAYYLNGNGVTLGAVTLLPVVFAVCWIVGTMALLEIPFNVLTGTVTSFTIGLGVAYNIHVSSRYTLELQRNGTVDDALRTAMTGTGGALFGSVATTALGFSTLALAFIPAVQQFGVVTALTIVYAFLSSVLVLPTLLVGWTRYRRRSRRANSR